MSSYQSTAAMRWDKVQQRGGSGGPGVRWGHTCNAIKGGKFIYVFGGYGKNQCQTNRVHVFDTVNMLWTETLMKGAPPTPRDSHSCTTVGDNLFVFGGTDGRRPLNDLHVLDTASSTWIYPNLRGNGPEPREGHSAALIGKRLFIFGGCGKSENSEIYYDDLYILNTETFSWKRVVPSGTPPSKRDSHTCSSWKNKIIVIGGEDSSNYYLSDVHILDADTLVWCKLNTTGQLLPPRGGHTTISFGKNLFVFGGFSDEQNLFDDVHMLDIENGSWTKVIAIGEGPSGRFSMAGDNLDPQVSGVLVYIGGCNKSLEALNDMYYLHTGFSREIERDERRFEKLSLRKQLKLKCQEQQIGSPAPFTVDHDTTIYQPMPISSYIPPGMQNFYVNEFQSHSRKRAFQAKVTKNLSNGYTIETVIDGKLLHGVIFTNKQSSTSTDTDKGKVETEQNDGTNVNGSHNSALDSEKSMEHLANDDTQADVTQEEKGVTDVKEEVVVSDIKNPGPCESSMSEEVSQAVEPTMAPETFDNVPKNPSSPSNAEIVKEGVSAAVMDQSPPLI